MAKKTTYVTFVYGFFSVFDETGSMKSIKSDTNRFSLLKFDSNRLDKPYVDVPIKDVEPLTDETYQPGAMTSLIDACYKAIKATEEKVGKKKANVAVTIQTDGYENASTEYTNKDLAALIKEKTTAGWLFTFLGAGIDAFAVAGEWGISADTTMTYDRDKSDATFAAAATGTQAYGLSGATADAAFTTSQRKASGGHMPKAGNVTAAAKRTKRKASKMVEDFSL